MARSQRLRSLEGRLGVLRRHLLPATFSLTGQYTDRQYDRAHGYRVLAHAELEACIEDLAMGTINSAYKAWRIDRKPRACLISLLAYYEAGFDPVPEDISSQGGASSSPLRDRVDAARNVYIDWVRNRNHGIREKNVLKVLLPAGILESDLSSAWLQTIDAFGDLRGTTAHTAIKKTQQPPDPKGELQMVRDIVTGLVPLDAKLSTLAR